MSIEHDAAHVRGRAASPATHPGLPQRLTWPDGISSPAEIMPATRTSQRLAPLLRGLIYPTTRVLEIGATCAPLLSRLTSEFVALPASSYDRMGALVRGGACVDVVVALEAPHGLGRLETLVITCRHVLRLGGLLLLAAPAPHRIHQLPHEHACANALGRHPERSHMEAPALRPLLERYGFTLRAQLAIAETCSPRRVTARLPPRVGTSAAWPLFIAVAGQTGIPRGAYPCGAYPWDIYPRCA